LPKRDRLSQRHRHRHTDRAAATKSREHVSFSTNNYLAISASPRMKAAAIRGIETYGACGEDYNTDNEEQKYRHC